MFWAVIWVKLMSLRKWKTAETWFLARLFINYINHLSYPRFLSLFIDWLPLLVLITWLMNLTENTSRSTLFIEQQNLLIDSHCHAVHYYSHWKIQYNTPAEQLYVHNYCRIKQNSGSNEISLSLNPNYSLVLLKERRKLRVNLG